jgi:enoyl-CoA hydratase
MDLEQFRLDVADGIVTVTFDRPPVNAQNRRTREELIRVFDAISDRDDIRVAILTGAGNTFSAGADLKERVDLVHEPGDYARHNRLVREFFYAVTDCSKPVIAAVNGPAIGAGFVLMLACDIMLASDNAYVSMPEINVGLAGGARFLMEHVSRSRARLMYLTGRRIPAARDRGLPAARRAHGGRARHCPRHRRQEPARHPPHQARLEHDRGAAGARRLPLRAERNG